jgi:hypothetical protein
MQDVQKPMDNRRKNHGSNTQECHSTLKSIERRKHFASSDVISTTGPMHSGHMKTIDPANVTHMVIIDCPDEDRYTD